ncbi:hypothetical protein AVEN_50105-1 [Araneus ventricosus]|uniref:Growth arrest-specific protein 8 domain-containing protein n=2 Tax=Araneus ventricosus TaxID=182803 RepID=A0A4Y2FU71_ARAVE|nr:hypothetical protein AVEN_50105-1 [Araneus ventricosus]
MPPKKEKDKKKKGEEEEVVGYDVKIMNISELKQYAHMLEKDIENMRECCTFFQKTEDKLVDVYRRRQEELKQKEDSILAKNIEMEKLRLDVQRKIQEKRQRPKYTEYACEKEIGSQVSEMNEKLEEGHHIHKNEQDQLRMKMMDKERELEAETKKIQMARKTAVENNSKKLKEMDEYERNLLEKSIKAFVAMLEEGSQINRLAMKTIETEAQEAKRKAEQEFRNACGSYKQKLQDYYKEITRQDLQAIKDLASKTKNLETTIQSLKTRLREVQEQNASLQADSRQKRPTKYIPGHSRIDSKTKLAMKFQKERRIDELKKENDLLQDKIKAVEEETVNLRRRFTQALYKVRQSAEMKTRFLESKLQSISKHESFIDDESPLR